MNNEAMTPGKKHFLLPLILITQEQDTRQDAISNLFIFLIQYSFLFNEPTSEDKILKRDFPNIGELSSTNSNGARYLDPKYSRWISVDPALGEYVPGVGKANAKDAGGLPGMGGIYNSVNGNLYHYAGNNPVRYVDPNGEQAAVARITLKQAIKIGLKRLAPKAAIAALDGPGIIIDIGVGIWLCYDVYQIYKNYQVADDGSSQDSEAKPKDEPSPMPKSGHLEGKDKGNTGQTADPPGEYPGDDPTKPPEGYEWRGKPGSQPGGKDGSYYDPGTGEVLRPDLDHPEGIDPHWDYKDPSGNWWRWFPGD